MENNENKDINIRVSREAYAGIKSLAEAENMTLKEYLLEVKNFFSRNKISVKENVEITNKEILSAVNSSSEKIADRLFRFLKTQEKTYLEPFFTSVRNIEGGIEFLITNTESKSNSIQQPKIEETQNIPVIKNTSSSDEINKLKIQVEKAELLSAQIANILQADFLQKGSMINNKFVVSIPNERKNEIIEFLKSSLK